MRLRHVALLASVSALAMGAICSERPLPASLQGDPRCPLTLGPEDIVSIRVFGVDSLSGDYQADTGGNLDFPYVGRTNVVGKTNTSLADTIRVELIEREYLVDPQVSVLIKEHNSAKVSVSGRVSKPGTFAFNTGMTLREAISLAGGMERIADQRNVKLTRATNQGPTTNTVSVRAIYDGRFPDVRLCPGDSIHVEESPL